MELAEAREILGRVDAAVPTAEWNEALATAAQRALAELYLLNPYDDVDGRAGPRTRAAWALFKEAAGLSGPETMGRESAGRLAAASANAAEFIGELAVELQPDFEFRRSEREANRERSVAALVSAARARGLTRAQIAYIVATAEHESAQFATLEEYASGKAYEGRASLGNTQPGDGPRFNGRGYVQLTGRRNYMAYAERSGIELVKLPIILMNWPALSVWVIVDGMMRGAYTGKRLGTYVNGSKQDFFNARRVVNGTDRAQKIADRASWWMTKLG